MAKKFLRLLLYREIILDLVFHSWLIHSTVLTCPFFFFFAESVQSFPRLKIVKSKLTSPCTSVFSTDLKTYPKFFFFFFLNQNSIQGGGSEREDGKSFVVCHINGAASLLRGVGDCPRESEN